MRIRTGLLQSQPKPVVAAALIVSQQERGAVDLRHDEIQIAIGVDVGKASSSTDDRLRQIPGALDRGEASSGVLASIPIELSRLSVVLARLHLVDLFFQVEEHTEW